jgi:hypothetical protein
VRFARRLFHLKALALIGRERRVVGYLLHQLRDIVAEAGGDLIPPNALIFDRVVQKRRND